MTEKENKIYQKLKKIYNDTQNVMLIIKNEQQLPLFPDNELLEFYLNTFNCDLKFKHFLQSRYKPKTVKLYYSKLQRLKQLRFNKDSFINEINFNHIKACYNNFVEFKICNKKNSQEDK